MTPVRRGNTPSPNAASTTEVVDQRPACLDAVLENRPQVHPGDVTIGATKNHKNGGLGWVCGGALSAGIFPRRGYLGR